MSDEHKKSTKAQLALALANGVSAAQWAWHQQVPKRTAYRWAKDPDVRKAVEAYRRRTIDQAIGLMTKKTIRAAGVIASLVEEGESHTVRLRACRAIFSDMMAVSKYSGLESRMLEIEADIAQQKADAGGGYGSPMAYGPRPMAVPRVGDTNRDVQNGPPAPGGPQ